MLHSAAAGLMVHGLYLGGVFVAIENGVSAGLAALIVSLQPVLTSTIANRWLGERVAARQWLGLALGLLGVYLVLHEKTASGGATPFGWLSATVALIGITAGTLYQKRFGGGMDWRPALCIQYARGRDPVCVRRVCLRDARRALDARNFCSRSASWSFALSLGAIWLYYYMIRRAAATRVTSLFYLDAADHGADGMGDVRRAARAAGARRHGGLRRRRVSRELAAGHLVFGAHHRPRQGRERGGMFYDQFEVLAGVVGGEFDEFDRRPRIGEKPRIFQASVQVGVDQFARLVPKILGAMIRSKILGAFGGWREGR